MGHPSAPIFYVDRKTQMDGFETWKHEVTTASDEELWALHEADYLGLVVLSEGWRPYIRVVQEEMQRRGIERRLTE